MSTVVIILAALGIAGGAYAALEKNVTAAGLAVVAVGLAVLLPLVLH